VRKRLGLKFVIALGVVLVLSLVTLASCSKTNTTTTVAPTTSESQISGETTSSLAGSTTSVTELTTTTTTASATTTTAASNVADLYTKLCAGCHSSKPGSGLTASQVAGVITNGTTGMPGFSSQLTSEQIQQLGDYLAAPTASTTTTTAAQTTSALYSQKCAGCHSTRPGAGLTASQAAGIIRNGTAGMPGFASQLTSAQISNLGAYVARPTASTTTTTAATTAAALYAQKCAGCHSTRPGSGLTQTQVDAVISNGTTGMPGFASQLTSAQIEQLGDYLAASSGSTTTTTAPSTTAALYTQKCAGCHSTRPGAGLTATQAAGIIANGTTGMPGFAGQLTPTQISDLGAYLVTPAWKSLTYDIFATELNKVGITVVGSGPSGTYTKDGVTIAWDDLLEYLPADEFYKDAQGYHYVQEEGAINPTTGLPAGVTKPPTTTTTTTSTTTTTTTTLPTTTTTGGTTTTTGGTTTTTGAIDAAALYTQFCAGCHSGGVGTGLTATAIGNTITNGKGIMLGFSGSMTGAQITALAAYVAAGGH
jgi:mono/diheme cytochrome c family protein